MGAFKRISFGGKTLGNKMHIVFVLMSLIPLLIMTYLVTLYIFPDLKENISMVGVTIIVLFAFWVAFSGYMLAKEIVLPVINLSLETKLMSNDNFDKDIFIGNEGALGDIENAVNDMSGQIRGYVGELQEYNRKTTSLNSQIHKKVLTLMALMKIGDMITAGRNYNDILKFSAEKISEGAYGTFCGIFLKEDTGRYTVKAFCDSSLTGIKPEDIASELLSVEKILAKKSELVIDSSHKEYDKRLDLRKKIENINAVFVPMKINTGIVGIIMMGNLSDNLNFTKEDMNGLRAFAKELVLGYQSAKIGESVKQFDVVDNVTGLYSFSYLRDRLEDEINRAIYYQRPCSLIVVKLDDFDRYLQGQGTSKTEYVLKRVSEALSQIIPPVGKLSRSGEDEFSLLLPEKNKRESMELAEEICKKISGMKISANQDEKITASIGVGENPIDGASADEIIERARNYSEKAKASGKNRVVGWD